MIKHQLNVEAARVHEANAKWWIDIKTGEPLQRNVGELLMLCVSELSEALEGHRKDLMDDKLLHRKMFEVELADCFIRLLDIAGGFGLDLEKQDEDKVNHGPIGDYAWDTTDRNVAEGLLLITRELTRAYDSYVTSRDDKLSRGDVRYIIDGIFELARLTDCDLLGAYEEKMAYNAVRADHKVENRLKADGKKY